MESHFETNRLELKTKIAGRDIELAGAKSVVLEALMDIERLYGQKASVTNVATGQPSREKHSSKTKTQAIRIPNVDELMSYLTTRDKFQHDILEIEDVFLGQRVTARNNQTAYRRLNEALQKARHKIELTKQGKFEAQLTSSKNLKRYVFRPTVHSLPEFNPKQPTAS